jgi:hypothetical protein
MLAFMAGVFIRGGNLYAGNGVDGIYREIHDLVKERLHIDRYHAVTYRSLQDGNIFLLFVQTKNEGKQEQGDMEAHDYLFTYVISDTSAKVLSFAKQTKKYDELINSIVQDNGNYSLNNNTKAIAYRVLFSPSNTEVISLYTFSEGVLKNVLDEIITKGVFSDKDGDCVCDYSAIFIMSPRSTNGYSDIVVKYRKKPFAFTSNDSSKVCEDIFRRDKPTMVLRFNGEVYK